MKRPLAHLLLSAAALLAVPAATAAVEVISTGGRNVYRLAVAQTGTERLVIGTTWDNRLCAFSVAGRHRWDAALGGFTFDVGCADLDGDGVDEIFTAGADGVVGCFSADGTALWRYASPAPLQQVTVARLDGKTPVVLAGGMSREILVLSPKGQVNRAIKTEGTLGNVAIRMLRAGDFDGDGRDEVGLMGLRGRALDVQFLKGMELKALPEAFSLNALKTANGTVADIDGDGAVELLVGTAILSLKGQVNNTASTMGPPAPDKGQVKKAPRPDAKGQVKNAGRKGQVVNAPGGPARLPEEPRAASYDYHYRMRSLAAGNFTDQPGREIALLDGPDLQLTTASGRVLGAAHAPISFSDLVCLPGSPHDSIILGSGLGGDDNLYRVTFDRDWQKQLASLPRSGQRQAVGENLGLLARQAAAWKGQPMAGADGPIDVIVTHHMWAGAASLQTVDAWIEEVKFFERNFPYSRLRFSTCIWPGEKRPLLRPDGQEWTFDRRLAYNLTRDQLLTIARKFEQARCPFWIQVGHGCAPHLSAESAIAMLGAAPSMGLGFVSAEDSNTRTADVHLAARVGLWLDGQVDDWACRVSADWFSFNRAWEWEAVKTGHSHLRYLTSQAFLGARVFMLLAGDRARRSGDWTRVGREGVAPFLHLVGRGALTPPKREQLKGIAPLVLNLPQVSPRFARHGANGHGFFQWDADGTDRQAWAFERLDCYWGMAPLPATDVSTWLWGRTRRAADHLPITSPHGFVCLLPGPAPRARGLWTTVWTTDGDHLSKDGKRHPLAAARAAMEADLQTAAATLPFGVAGRVFWQVVAQPENRYVICVLDPGWVDPAPRTAILRANLPGVWTVSDRLTGKPLGRLGSGLEVPVPAGGFRLIDVR